jgi:gliding motility-associated-like protein
VNLGKKISNQVFAGLLIGCTSYVYSQPTTSDCQGAIPVCDITYNVPTLNPAPNNVPNEINPQLSCLSSGENAGNWYTFTVQSDGVLGFNIIPIQVVDYDWALFNLTGATCSDIFQNASLQVACNYSSSINNGGITGANGGGNLQDHPLVPVQTGQTFVLYVSNYNFNQNAAGYLLDFGLSTAQVPDNTPPVLTSVSAGSNCNATSLLLTFSENILCSSVSASDFSFSGASGSFNISSVSSADCSSGANYSKTFTVNISPGLSQSGTYQFQVVGSVSDVCGNALQGSPILDLNYSALNLALSSSDSDCDIPTGSASVLASDGVPPYTYAWNDPASQTGAIAGGLFRGWYTVKVQDAAGCTVRDSVWVGDPTDFVLNFSILPDTCYKGAGIVNMNIVGNTAPFTIVWQDSLLGGTQWTGAYGDSTYKVKVSDVDLCWRDTVIKMTVVLNDTLKADFTMDKDKVNFLLPTVNLVDQSVHAYSILWDIEGFYSSDLNVLYDFPRIGKIPVLLTAFDANGCSASVVKYVEVFYDLSFFIPNAFTPNSDGLNEVFSCTGVGIDSNRFKLLVFNHMGSLIYETNNLKAGWNGTFADGITPAPQGTYVWQVEFFEIKGLPHVFRGRVHLIR